MKRIFRGGLIVTFCMTLLGGMTTVPVHATNYNAPVPRIPNDPIAISDLITNSIYTVEDEEQTINGTLEYTGSEIRVDGYLSKSISESCSVLVPDEDYTVTIEGANIRKELVKEAYTEIVDIHGDYSYRFQDEQDYNTYDFSTLISFYKFARRLNMKFSDQSVLLDIKMGIPSSFSLEELRQYSCAREFIEKTGYMCNDNPYQGYTYGYVSQLDDTITPDAKKKGYASIQDYMDSVVSESKDGVTYWKEEKVTVWPVYYVVPRTAITKKKAEEFSEKNRYKLLSDDDNWYFSATYFTKWNNYAKLNYSKKISEYATELGIGSSQMECLFEAEERRQYTTYYNFTEHDAIQAWADEMDTWSGHWDYFLYGDTNFDYWFKSTSVSDPGYYMGNWGQGMKVIVDRLNVYHEPEYIYYVTGPGEFTITFTGKNNQDGHGRANILGSVSKKIRVVKGSGSYFQGPSNTWIFLGEDWYYFDESGNVKTGWLLDKGCWYYMRDDGKMSVGWSLVDGKWYYFNGDGVMATGWQKLNGAWYYMSSDGSMVTGWVTSGGQWYYMKKDGTMATGWIKDAGKWYCFDDSGAMITGWLKYKNSWYYFARNGAMATGWVASGKEWYHMNKSGAMDIGWIQDGDARYYLYESGVMARNVWVGNYYLTSSGAMAKNTWIDSFYVGEDGAWIPD